MANISVATKKPKGLTITRDGYKYYAAWKITDKDYGDGQQLEFREQINGKWSSWHSVDVGKTTTSKKFLTLGADDFYPMNQTYKLNAVEVRVRGNRKKYSETKDQKTKTYQPKWSDWATASKTFSAPPKPSVSAALTTYNTTTFTWSVSTSAKDWKPFREVQWESVLVKNCQTTDGSKVSWKNATTGRPDSASSSQSFAETGTVPNGNYTRWFRVRARGSAGTSAWAYSRRVFSTPSVPKILASGTSAANKSNAYLVTANWQSDANAANNPIDSSAIEYAMQVPEAGYTYTGNSWTDSGLTITDVAGTNSAKFTTSGVLDLDQCLFLRVINKHENNTMPSPAYCLLKGKMKSPTLSNVEIDGLSVEVTAQNTSDVPSSYMSAYARAGSRPNANVYIGAFPASTSEQTRTFTLPSSFASETSIAIGVRAYGPNAQMASDFVFQDSPVPVAPTGVTAVADPDKDDTIRVTWNWNWSAATGAELSWADHDDAWQSTDEPQTYKISRLKTSEWYISGLETGKTWYVRIRLVKEGDTDTYSAWSTIAQVNLASAPEKPILQAEPDTVVAGDTVTCTWVYVSTDGTLQSAAEIVEATVSGGTTTYSDPIARTTTAQFAPISTNGWSTGETHLLCVRVFSRSGYISDYSSPIAVKVADPLSMTVEIDDEAFGSTTVTEEGGDSYTEYSLKKLPFDVAVSGLSASDTVTLVVERAEDYIMERPDESEHNGHAGEIAVAMNFNGNGTITVTQDDVIGYLDDGAKYILRVTARDQYGQTDPHEEAFTVRWTHQAVKPDATIEIVDDYAVITVEEPEEAETGDTFDVYRLSTDKPELIIQNGTFDTAYVDPYPAIGENGGHRVVFKTVNGDYITDSPKSPAWTDYRSESGDVFLSEEAIIDFGGDKVRLYYNVSMSSQWQKDFQSKRYMGGSVQGYWNAGVQRSGSVDAVAITLTDNEMIQSMRRLADYDGICHIRTKDGSSFSADVQVQEKRDRKNEWIIPEFSLSFTKVDPEELDGILLSEFLPEEESE